VKRQACGEESLKISCANTSKLLLLASTLLWVGKSSAQKTLNAAIVDSYLEPYVQSGNFAGNVLVKKNGRVVFQKAYALADRERRVRNTRATRFHIASVSMQFTAAAVLRLVDQGAISLDTQVGDIVPGITGGDKITVRDLLMQRSGLADINELPDYSDILSHHQTPATLVEKIKDRPLLFEPGSKFVHEEHSAYNLLAWIVEKKTSLPFAAAMAKLVFRPSGLKASGIDDDSMKSEPNLAKGYQPDGVYGLKPASAIHWSAKTGNASVVTTTEDQARWVDALFGDRLLKAPSREAILDPSQRVGYGWFRRTNQRFNEATFYMNGRAPGFASFVLYLPREHTTVVVFSNIYSSATTNIGYDLAAMALGLPYETFHPGDPAPSPAELKTCTGTFRFGPDFYQANAEVILTVEGSELLMRWPSGETSPLIPLKQDHYVDRAYWEEVRIERDAAGLPITVVYDHFRGSVVSAAAK
jgi:D-alanyl-D-alanine carboxypeptidase